MKFSFPQVRRRERESDDEQPRKMFSTPTSSQCWSVAQNSRTVEEIEMKIFEIKISRTLHWNLITRSWKLSSFQTLITRFQQLMLRIISLLLWRWDWCDVGVCSPSSLHSSLLSCSHLTQHSTEVSTFNSFIIKSPQGSLALRRDWEFSTLKLCVSCARFGDRHSHTCCGGEWCSGEVGKGAAKATDGWKWKRKREIKWKRIASRIVQKNEESFFNGTGNSSLGSCCCLTQTVRMGMSVFSALRDDDAKSSGRGNGRNFPSKVIFPLLFFLDCHSSDFRVAFRNIKKGPNCVFYQNKSERSRAREPNKWTWVNGNDSLLCQTLIFNFSFGGTFFLLAFLPMSICGVHVRRPSSGVQLACVRSERLSGRDSAVHESGNRGDGKSPPFFRYVCCCYCACYLLSLPLSLSLSRHTSTIHDAESITSHRGNSTYPSESSAERENVSKTNTFFCVTISYVGSLNVID